VRLSAVLVGLRHVPFSISKGWRLHMQRVWLQLLGDAQGTAWQALLVACGAEVVEEERPAADLLGASCQRLRSLCNSSRCVVVLDAVTAMHVRDAVCL
jgi:hypothetical protein